MMSGHNGKHDQPEPSDTVAPAGRMKCCLRVVAFAAVFAAVVGCTEVYAQQSTRNYLLRPVPEDVHEESLKPSRRIVTESQAVRSLYPQPARHDVLDAKWQKRQPFRHRVSLANDAELPAADTHRPSPDVKTNSIPADVNSVFPDAAISNHTDVGPQGSSGIVTPPWTSHEETVSPMRPRIPDLDAVRREKQARFRALQKQLKALIDSHTQSAAEAGNIRTPDRTPVSTTTEAQDSANGMQPAAIDQQPDVSVNQSSPVAPQDNAASPNGQAQTAQLQSDDSVTSAGASNTASVEETQDPLEPRNSGRKQITPEFLAEKFGTAVVDGPVDRIGLANNLFAINENVIALEMYQQVETKNLTPGEKYWIMLQKASCLRRLDRIPEAKEAYRRLAGEKDAGFLAKTARWWLDRIEDRVQLTTQLNQYEAVLESLQEKSNVDSPESI